MQSRRARSRLPRPLGRMLGSTEFAPNPHRPNMSDKSLADGKILQSVVDGVGVITFNNPDKRNAMSLEMWEGLGEALIAFRDDPAGRVVILVGAGDKAAFVPGADISQFEKTRHNAEASEEYSRRSAAQRALLADYPKPTIACIRGFCLGGGMQVAMLTDIRISGASGQFGIPAARLGIAYGYDGLRHLVSLVGPSWARLIMYTGMRIDAAEALRIGLVDRVLPDAELWDATMEIARTISGNAPLAIKAAKITIAQVLKDPADRDMAAIRQIGIDCMDSADFREGRSAFMESASRSSRALARPCRLLLLVDRHRIVEDQPSAVRIDGLAGDIGGVCRWRGTPRRRRPRSARRSGRPGCATAPLRRASSDEKIAVATISVRGSCPARPPRRECRAALSATAAAEVSCFIAALRHRAGRKRGIASSALTEDMLTTTPPPPCAIIWRAAA